MRRKHRKGTCAHLLIFDLVHHQQCISNLLCREKRCKPDERVSARLIISDGFHCRKRVSYLLSLELGCKRQKSPGAPILVRDGLDCSQRFRKRSILLLYAEMRRQLSKGVDAYPPIADRLSRCERV